MVDQSCDGKNKPACLGCCVINGLTFSENLVQQLYLEMAAFAIHPTKLFYWQPRHFWLQAYQPG